MLPHFFRHGIESKEQALSILKKLQKAIGQALFIY